MGTYWILAFLRDTGFWESSTSTSVAYKLLAGNAELGVGLYLSRGSDESLLTPRLSQQGNGRNVLSGWGMITCTVGRAAIEMLEYVG
jgi:hypothetical protein